ncbi:MAG: HAMP domain-containing histidine kinase [Sandarakinorhabdus sp.]|nr:HAMP domain-containing histidine kinase [Sandarakinorhabdus sp.]
MRSARLSRFVASTGFRIALLNLILVSLTMAVAAAAAWIATRNLAEVESRARIGSEAQAIRLEAAEEGLAAAAGAVLSRAEHPGALEYRLTGRDGQVLAGDLVLGNPVPGWSRRAVRGIEADGNSHGDLLVYTEQLPGGGRLSVADDLSRSEAVRNAIFRSIALWGGLAAALGLGISMWLTVGTLARMDAVVDTVAAVGHGDLAARASVSGRGDDIDMLAAGINAMLDQIGLLVQALKRVSADVAHELRTPLTHVGQRLDRAAGAPDDSIRMAELAAASQALAQALRLFDAMLRLAEIDGGQARMRFGPVDLAEIIERVADAYRPEVEASGRELAVKIDIAGKIHGDKDLIAQAIANLVENSLKHGASGTEICLAVTRHRDGIAAIVSDDGPGVDGNAIPRLAEPFFRIARARLLPGAGIGLAIVAAIARLHGARLEILGKSPGLVVGLYFPMVVGELIGGASDAAEVPATTAGRWPRLHAA